MTTHLYLSFTVRVSADTVQQVADSLHGALQRNGSGAVCAVDLSARRVEILSERGHPDDVILALLKAKRLLPDATITYRIGKTGREKALFPKAPPGGARKLELMLKTLRQRHTPPPCPLASPTPAEIAAVQRELGIAFHPDYRRFLQEASTLCVGTLEPLTLEPQDGDTDFRAVFHQARALPGFPAHLFPICEDNGDYYCMSADGKAANVFYWSHNGTTDETWADLGTWIEAVWLGEG
jgi:hypothetical protein